MLNWADSVFCIDIKNENFETTAGYRAKQGHKVYKFAPFAKDNKSHCYNPLDHINTETYKRFQDLRRMAQILIPDTKGDNKYWTSQGRALFIALCYYVLEKDDFPSTIGAVYRLLGTEQELGDIARHIAKTYTIIEPEVKSALNNFANRAAKERMRMEIHEGSPKQLLDDLKILLKQQY